MSQKLNVRHIQKHGAESDWAQATNFTPLLGELIIYDPDDNYSYARIKVGDGVTNVNELPFITAGTESEGASTNSNSRVILASTTYSGGLIGGIISSDFSSWYSTTPTILHVLLNKDIDFSGAYFYVSHYTNMSAPVLTYYNGTTWADVANITDGRGFDVGQELVVEVKGNSTGDAFEYIHLLNLPYPAAEDATFGDTTTEEEEE